MSNLGSAYKRGRIAYIKCVGDPLGITGNPGRATHEVLAEFERGYADAREERSKTVPT